MTQMQHYKEWLGDIDQVVSRVTLSADIPCVHEAFYFDLVDLEPGRGRMLWCQGGMIEALVDVKITLTLTTKSQVKGDDVVGCCEHTLDSVIILVYDEANNNKEVQQIANEILQAKMNFTHFVTTSEQLSSDLFPTLCHDLLRRSAALQLCENQVTYDQLIPIYFGNEQGTFEPSQCGVILIQNKNRESATTIASMFNEPFVTPSLDTKKPSKRAKYLQKSERALRNRPNFIFNKMEKPILFLMFDMGTKTIRSPPVEVSHSDGNMPQIWAVHSRNHKGETFSCLKEMDSSGNSATFFTSVTAKVGLYADIAKENIGYGKLSRDARYGKLVDSTLRRNLTAMKRKFAT